MRAESVDVANIMRLEARWRELLPDSPAAFFLSLEWSQVVWATFGYEPGTAVYVVYGEDDQPIGILPVWRRRMNRFGLFRLVSEAFGGRRGDYSHPLLCDPTNEAALRSLLRVAMRGARRDGALVLPNVPEEGGWSERVRKALIAEGMRFSENHGECLRTLLPDTFEEFTGSVQGKFRREVRRRLRKLEEDIGPATLEFIRNPAEARSLLPIFFEMHDRRWVEAGQPGAFSDPLMRKYFFEMVDRLWDHLHVTVLRAGGEPVAIHFGMTSGASLLLFKTTFDVSLSKYAPGKVHLWMLVERAIEEGLSMMDFMQGEESYKSEWATDSLDTTTFVIRAKPFSLTYWWLTEGRSRAERWLGKVYLRLATLGARLRKRGGP